MPLRRLRAACAVSAVLSTSLVAFAGGRTVADPAGPPYSPADSMKTMEIEQGFALSVYGALRAHGYVPTNKVANLQFAGVAAAALRRDGVIVGAADPRRDGVAAGVR